MEIKRLDDEAVARWDAFAEQCPQATFFHRAGWKRVIESGLGHRCHYLYADVGGEIRGLLPLVYINSWLFGNALISNAFCVYGGVASNDPVAHEALEAEALKIARSDDVDYIEYRNQSPVHKDWPRNSELYATFRRRLDRDPDKNMSAIPRKQRAMVRKGMKAGLRGEFDASIDRFFPIYAESVRNLGTPVLPKRYFTMLKQVFGDACKVLTVVHETGPLSSVMSFYYRDHVLPYYGGGTPAARRVAANDFMYWEVMRHACEQGYRVFDFGRSKRGTGSFAFKTHWGFEPHALHYEYKLLRRNEVPATNPLNPKYAFFIALWKRLPLTVSSLIGPSIARNLG